MITAFYAVDRIEGKIVVLVADDGTTLDVPRSTLPTRLREGTVLRVRLGANGKPDWSSAEIDRDEEERRLKEANDTLNEMKRSDPGGDITL
ncbi:MAG TPA: DUF3006 domain-containing protein [Gemmatimonadales bacterium]|nr:DUF3006 domain-containing protein [Gemmatimonadales bacterium]